MCVGRLVCVVSVLCVCVRPLSSVEPCDVLVLVVFVCMNVCLGGSNAARRPPWQQPTESHEWPQAAGFG